MAKFGAQLTRWYFGGYDVGTATTSWSLTLAVMPLDPTAITDAGERALAGIRQDAVEWSGLFDDSQSGDAAGSALIGSGTRNVLTVFIGTGTGSVAYAGTGIITASRQAGGAKDLVAQELELKIDGSLERGVSHGIRATIGTGTALGTHDNSASSTNGGTWYVQIFSTTTGTLFLQDSADGTTWAAITSGTITFTGRDSRKVTFTGTARRYTRTLLGTAGTATATVAAMVIRG